MYTTLLFFGWILFPIPALLQSIRKGLNPYVGVMDGVVSVGFGSVMIFAFASFSGTGIGAEVDAAMAASIAAMSDSLGSQTEAYMASLDVAAMMFPSMILIVGGLSSYLEYLILSKFVRSGGKGALQMAPFREFSWPRTGIYGWMLIFIISWIIGQTDMQGADVMMLNVENLFEIAFALQGTSFFLMFLHIKKIPKGVAVGLVLLAWLLPYGKSILFLAGIGDIMFGLRGRIAPR